MGEYVKALLVEDGPYEDEDESTFLQCCQLFHVTTSIKFFLLLDVFLGAIFLLYTLPYSLPFWPFVAIIFVTAIYAISHEQPGMLRPLLMLIIFALTICPAFLGGLLATAILMPDLTQYIFNVFFPLSNDLLENGEGHVNGPSSLILFELGLLLIMQIPFLYGQLRTIWLCQQFYQLCSIEREVVRGYSELGINDPFLDCQVESEGTIKKRVKSEMRVPLTVLPDYKVFSLQEEEKQEEEVEDVKQPLKS